MRASTIFVGHAAVRLRQLAQRASHREHRSISGRLSFRAFFFSTGSLST